MSKLIITVAPNGSLPTKEHTPHVPVTPEEVIEDGIRCWEAGAAVLHFHARDAEQKPSLDYDFFARVLEGLRAHTDLIVQFSTGFRAARDREDRIRAVDLRPDMMSLNVGSINFPRGVYINLPEDAEYWAGRMQEYSVKPEIECFDLSHIETGIRLWRSGLVGDPPLFQVVMGVQNALSYSPENLFRMVSALPAGALWNAMGVGRAQLQVATLATVMGGHCRVGLEDNLYYSHRVLARNVELVERAARIAGELQRPVATRAEAREILGIAHAGAAISGPGQDRPPIQGSELVQ